MIRVSLKNEEDKLRLVLLGHADYAPRGSDIVCAAASGIFYAVLGYLVNFGKEDFSVNAVREGYADLACGKQYAEILKLVILGLLQLEITYPGHISVVEDVWNFKLSKTA